MSGTFTESTVEDVALAWLESTGWDVAHGPDIAPLPDPACRQARRQAGDTPGGRRGAGRPR